MPGEHWHLACSSCFFGEEHVRWAYYISALLMLLTPVAMLVGGILWYRRAALAANSGEAEAGPESPAAR